MAAADAASAAAWHAHRQQLLGMTAFDRHKRLMADYVTYYGGRAPEPPPVVATRTDHDILREQYRWGLAATGLRTHKQAVVHPYHAVHRLCPEVLLQGAHDVYALVCLRKGSYGVRRMMRAGMRGRCGWRGATTPSCSGSTPSWTCPATRHAPCSAGTSEQSSCTVRFPDLAPHHHLPDGASTCSRLALDKCNRTSALDCLLLTDSVSKLQLEWECGLTRAHAVLASRRAGWA